MENAKNREVLMREFVFKGPDRWERCAEEAVRQKANGLEVNQYYISALGLAVIFDRPKVKKNTTQQRQPLSGHDLSVGMPYNPYGPHGHKRNGHTLR